MFLCILCAHAYSLCADICIAAGLQQFGPSVTDVVAFMPLPHLNTLIYIHVYCSHVHICAYKQVWLVSCTVQKCMYMCICALVVVDFYRSILIDCFYEAFAGKSGELIYCALPLSAATTNIFCTDAIVDDYTIHTYTHTHTNIQRH